MNVYWSCLNKEHLRAIKPKSVIQEYSRDKKLEDYTYLRCPAFIDTLKNTYSLKSLYEVSLWLEDKNLYCDLTQDFYNQNLQLRNRENKLVSLDHKYIFFTDEPSLTMSIQQPFLEQNDFANKSILVTGEMDIGKWFRPLDLAFHFKNDVNSISFEKDDNLMYAKFHTNKPIKFYRFYPTDKLQQYMIDAICIRNYTGKIMKTLDYYYKIFKNNNMKKEILTEIKNNILE